MKSFEIFEEKKKKGKKAKRKFKTILHEVYPDSCVDEINEVGTQTNKNGICWIEKYCEKALPSIKGMSLKVEFLDDERREICGHGLTDVVDGVAIFEDATMIGTFTDGYIADVELEDGSKIRACIGEGEIDSACYHNFCDKLDEDIANGLSINGSIEISATENNEGIIYKYGYKESSRIPTDFVYSGYALLAVEPADDTAKLIELNNKEEQAMGEKELKALVESIVEELLKSKEEIDQVKVECEQKIAEAQKLADDKVAELKEAHASSAAIQEALDTCRKELDAAHMKLDELYSEMDVLRRELGEAKAKERLGELDKAVECFSETEKDYAKAEIEEFKKDPVNSEINSIVSKIWEGIGKKAKQENVVAEQNSAKPTVEDIFSVVDDTDADDTNGSIF